MPPEAAPATPVAEATPDPTPTLAAGDILDEIMSEPAEGAAPEPDRPAEKTEPEAPAPSAPSPVLKLTDAELEKAIATPEGRKSAIKALRDAERKNHDTHVKLTKREAKDREREAGRKREYDAFTNVRASFMADVKIATTGTTEEALNALTRIRAGAGQSGADFLKEANLTTARNGKPAESPEIIAMRKEIADLKAEREKEKTDGQVTAHEQTMARRHAELASAVCDNPQSFPLASELGQANRDALHQFAWSYKQAHHAQHGVAMSDADAARRVETELQVLRQYPATLQYAKLGHLNQVVLSLKNLAETQSLDEAAALSRIETQLRTTFGAAPQGDAGRATSAQAAPDEPASLPGRTPSSRAANGGSTREPTNTERLSQFDDLFEELGVG